MISALALIPSEDIDNAWMIIRSRFTEYDSNVELLLEYVDNNWLCNLRPLFGRDVWSHHGILRGRTNNAAEGFHSKLSKLINKANSCFSEVLNTLKEIQISSEVELNRLIAGGVPKRRKKKYLDQEIKIERLWNLYNLRLISLEELLEGLKGAKKLDI